MSKPVTPALPLPASRHGLPIGLLLLASAALLPGCQQAEPPASAASQKEAKQDAKHDDLQKIIEEPQDRARAVEQQLRDNVKKTDRALDEQEKSDGSGS
ncbi:hypothetical protein [Pseudomarimonas arenosa]|uniref:Lipoprotein n=1 Tax=Pseudomarimonas arenosa TaxID=2774145 RepID=A0AAW3ZRP3_9GAMM|nr:hypothetical protein [Pseudomarimonas arenosa]MBD8527747.1 hypothetical protein [Pseudomarimonas arenosa]